MATHRTSVRIGAIAVLAAVIAFAASSSAVASKSSPSSARHLVKAATVQTRKIKHLGVVLVNSKGLTLYMFIRDHQKKVTCKSTVCVTFWPPLEIKKGQKPTAGGAARKGLLGTDRNPRGGRVVTYNRWPLYTYYLDKRPGQAKGQAKNLNGGLWYVLSPKGQIIKKKP